LHLPTGPQTLPYRIAAAYTAQRRMVAGPAGTKQSFGHDLVEETWELAL
jgi:hypothetical protein